MTATEALRQKGLLEKVDKHKLMLGEWSEALLLGVQVLLILLAGVLLITYAPWLTVGLLETLGR